MDITAWSKEHPKAYIAIVYVIGVALGFGLGYQVCLWVHHLQAVSVYVYQLLGAI